MEIPCGKSGPFITVQANFPWKMSSLLGSMSNSGWENIHHSSQQASSMMKIPSFPQQTNSMAKFHHFLKESKLPQK
jgi:hypothetical protein